MIGASQEIVGETRHCSVDKVRPFGVPKDLLKEASYCGCR